MLLNLYLLTLRVGKLLEYDALNKPLPWTRTCKTGQRQVLGSLPQALSDAYISHR